MAHYRKLQIGQQTYHYNIGKVYVEIRSSNEKQLIRKDDIGFRRHDDIIITPKMICDYINGKVGSVEHYFQTCDCEGVNKQLTVNPFDVEIGQRIHYVVLCNQCYNDIAADI